MAAMLLLMACGTAGGDTPPLTVVAAASLAEAFEGFAGYDPGPPVTYSFAGSQQLVAQVEAGVPADVVATADEAAMAPLVAAGLVEPPRILARNRLAIAVRPGNPRRVTVLGDLARPGLRVALADPSVPVGRYAARSLARASVLVRPVSLELDVKAVVARVASGEADAGIVYATDAARPSGIEAVAIPEDLNVEVAYPVAVIRSSRRLGPARAFVDRLLDEPAQAALRGRGFLAP